MVSFFEAILKSNEFFLAMDCHSRSILKKKNINLSNLDL